MSPSEPDFDKYNEFLDNEVRFRSLKIKNEKLAAVLLEEQKNNAIKRYNYFKNSDYEEDEYESLQKMRCQI